MKGIAPNIQKIGNMISAKAGSPSVDRSGTDRKGKKKHLNFNFLKNKK